MTLTLQFKVSLSLNNYDIASRRLHAIALSSQSLPSSLMSADAQFVLVETISQVLKVVSTQIDLISISAASSSLSTLQDIQIMFTTSYYATSNATLSCVFNILSASEFLSLLQSNAVNYSTSAANAYASVNDSSVTVQQTYPESSAPKDPTVLIIAIIVSIGGFLAVFGLCSFIYLRYLAKSYHRRHMTPLDELINEDADLGESSRV